MDSNKEIKKVFELFTDNKFEEAQELNNQILVHFPNHMYAKRYQKILADKIKFDKLHSTPKGEGLGVKSKTTKVRGKSLKCPHCLAKIPFSGLNGHQKEEIKKGNYNNLELKCPYCHTKFVLQKRKANSILGIKIGDIATIEGKKYRATGYVEYSGYWYEDGYSDLTKYLEWILLGEDNSYYYFSEGYSLDEGSSEHEFELSKKIIPNFRIPSNGTTFTKATVKSIYGENSKNYIVGEKTILYDFSNSGKNYVKEIEGAGSQKEAGIYETISISGNEAGKIFGKEISGVDFYNSGNNIFKGINGDNFWGIIFGGIFALTFLPFWLISLGIVLIIGYFIFKNKNKIKEKKYNPITEIGIIPKLLFLSIGGLIFINLVFIPIFNTILEHKEKIEISNLGEVKKAELKFKDFSIMEEKKTSSTRYDYGGIKSFYSKNTGLKFSVKNEEDKKIIEKIRNLEEDVKIKKMFDGDLYKLK